MNREEVERVHFLTKGRSHYCRKYLLSLKCSRRIFFLLLNLLFVPPNVFSFYPQSGLIFFSTTRQHTWIGQSSFNGGRLVATDRRPPRWLYAHTTSSPMDKSGQYSGKIIAPVSLTVDPRSSLSEGLCNSGRRGPNFLRHC